MILVCIQMRCDFFQLDNLDLFLPQLPPQFSAAIYYFIASHSLHQIHFPKLVLTKTPMASLLLNQVVDYKSSSLHLNGLQHLAQVISSSSWKWFLSLASKALHPLGFPPTVLTSPSQPPRWSLLTSLTASQRSDLRLSSHTSSLSTRTPVSGLYLSSAHSRLRNCYLWFRPLPSIPVSDLKPLT